MSDHQTLYSYLEHVNGMGILILTQSGPTYPIQIRTHNLLDVSLLPQPLLDQDANLLF